MGGRRAVAGGGRYKEPRATNRPMISRDKAKREIEETIELLESGKMNPPKNLTAEECVAGLRRLARKSVTSSSRSWWR